MITHRQSFVDRMKELSYARRLIDYQATQRARGHLREQAYIDWRRVDDPGNSQFLNGWDQGDLSDQQNEKWTSELHFQKPWYFRDPFGFVRLRGMAGHATSQNRNPIFNLPQDLWPGKHSYLFSHYAAYNEFAHIVSVEDCVVEVSSTDGAVRVKAYAQLLYSKILWVCFDNTRFRAANAGIVV